jgi:hypothetical protein
MLFFLSHMETHTLTQNPAPRFTSLIEELCRVLNKHASARFVYAPMLLLIWNRLTRLAKRFASLAERVQAGTLDDPAPARSQAALAPPAVTPDRPSAAPQEVLPHHFRWLVNMVPEAEAISADLCWLLQKLEVEELIFAAPRQAGRILRPLCKMLGVDPPSALQLPRAVRVRRLEETFEPAPEPEPEPEPVPAQPEDDSGWPQCLEPEPLSETQEENWKMNPPERPPKNRD